MCKGCVKGKPVWHHQVQEEKAPHIPYLEWLINCCATSWGAKKRRVLSGATYHEVTLIVSGPMRLHMKKRFDLIR